MKKGANEKGCEKLNAKMNTCPGAKDKKLLNEVHEIMRLHHYSIHTERAYCDWIKRFVMYHHMKSCQDMKDGERKIESFLTYLAMDLNVSPLRRYSSAFL